MFTSPSRLAQTVKMLGLGFACCCLTSVFAAAFLDYDARDWDAGNSIWVDRINGEALTVPLGLYAPTVTTSNLDLGTGEIFEIQSLKFTSNLSTALLSDTSPLTAGLKEFSLTAMIKVGPNPGAGGGEDGVGWNYKVIAGFETPQGNQGEFQFGFSSSDRLNASVGLNGDQFHLGGMVPANEWAVVSMVLEQIDPDTFSLRTYIDGVAQGTPTIGTYGIGTGASIANTPFGVGYNAISTSDMRFFDGEIAKLRFDYGVLSPEQIQLDAISFMGVAVPEPGKALFLIAGMLAGLMMGRGRVSR